MEQTGIGVVVPYDFALDRELWRWVPEHISLHLTRTPHVPLSVTMEMAIYVSNPNLLAQASASLHAVAPVVTAYACTSGSFVSGVTGETEIVAAMTQAGAPAALTTSGALLTALRHLDVSSVAAVTPYTADLTSGLVSFLGEAGIGVTAAAGLDLTTQIWTVPYEVTAELVRSIDRPDAEAIFISCTNLPTYDVIAKLEEELGKPVLSANQVTIWSALRAAGHKAVGPGQRLLAS
ncbi:Asp/Glu racemase [Mycolicibacterium smegmatis]|uniref:maleate cis-trans isomerase family protein n=1 Tax=Mycolicibacterium smegmatis TaxID=1772 RepID=UPI0020A43F26|nr:Asp/Glu racemase [Mycolicibacterium smegmatis]MCP2622502.1 Asp/Glu racemase [Mycolicibacterium smegmatis]